MLTLQRYYSLLERLVREVETNPSPLDSPVYAEARRAIDYKSIEWTEMFVETVARMRVYQRQSKDFRSLNSQQRKAAGENADAAGAYVDQCLRDMQYVPGKLPAPVAASAGLFTESEADGSGLFDEEEVSL